MTPYTHYFSNFAFFSFPSANALLPVLSLKRTSRRKRKYKKEATFESRPGLNYEEKELLSQE